MEAVFDHHMPIISYLMKSSLREFFLYGVVGGLGTAVHYAIMMTLVEVLAVAPVVATGIGCFAGAIVNYLLNHRLTFVSDACHKVALPKFMVVAIIGMVANVWMLYALLELLVIHYMIAQCLVTVLVMCITYTLNKFWTFSG